MVTLKNEYLQVEINELGAELTSVRSLENDLEYIWRADKKIWGRHAPILFPIVGRLKDDHYEYKGTAQAMKCISMDSLVILCLRWLTVVTHMLR